MIEIPRCLLALLQNFVLKSFWPWHTLTSLPQMISPTSCSNKHPFFIVEILGNWKLNTGPHTCEANVLTLSHTHVFLIYLFASLIFVTEFLKDTSSKMYLHWEGSLLCPCYWGKAPGCEYLSKCPESTRMSHSLSEQNHGFSSPGTLTRDQVSPVAAQGLTSRDFCSDEARSLTSLKKRISKWVYMKQIEVYLLIFLRFIINNDVTCMNLCY